MAPGVVRGRYVRSRRRCPRTVRAFVLAGVALLAGACATAPPIDVPVIAWEEKLDWMLRLEDQRLVRHPDPPERAVLRPADGDRPAVLGPAAPTDLIELLVDPEARVRRRAALALARVGARAATGPLTLLLAGDPEPQVRAMAAFALGQIGDTAAAPALVTALGDNAPLVQGRAAEALGRAGTADDAGAVAVMVRAHVDAGALNGIAPDELGQPLTPAAEAVRLGVYAMSALRAYESLAGAVLGADGNPVSRWWPIAYAFSRVGDERAVPVLLVLLDTDGARFTPAFAARGLGTFRAEVARPWLEAVLEDGTRPAAVTTQALRALVAIGGDDVPALLTTVAVRSGDDPHLRREAIEGLVQRPDPGAQDLLIDLMAHDEPSMRAAALRALARLDPLVLLGVLSGLDPDPDWTVRHAMTDAFAALPPEQARPRLFELLGDEDARVRAAVLRALVDLRAEGTGALLTERLRVEDLGVRMAAIEGLAALGDTSAVSPMLAAYEASAGEPTYLVPAALLGALDTLDPAAARPLLEAALADRRWPVRLRAAELLRARGADVEATVAPAPAWGGPGASMTADARALLLAPPFSPHAYLETSRGNIEVELAILDAPFTVATFMALARERFFDGLTLHRVVPDFVVQGGDPRGDGIGGPPFTIRDELNQRPYLRGTVGMALDWADTGGSQFFITHSPQPHLDGIYTVFGHVVAGLEILDQIQPHDRLISVRIWDGITPLE
jgi:cyclophilin family peptidyl-prolyl cis-trans isomerase/HEAT repeat protein